MLTTWEVMNAILTGALFGIIFVIVNIFTMKNHKSEHRKWWTTKRYIMMFLIIMIVISFLRVLYYIIS